MDELLSQDEINALLSGGTFDPSAGPGLSKEDSHVLDEVATLFSNSENSVFGMLAGKEVNSRIAETLVTTQSELKARLPETPFVFRATFGGLDDLPLILVIDRRGALTLADLMMGGEGKELPDEASELYLNATQEGLSQVVGSVFTSVSGLLGGRRLMPENVASALETGEWTLFPETNEENKVWASLSNVEIEELETFPLWIALPMDAAATLASAIHDAMGDGAPGGAPAAAESSPLPGASAPLSGPAQSAPASSPPSRGQGQQQPAPVVDVHPAEFVPLTPKSGIGGGGSRIDLIADIPVRVTVELGKTRKNISEILNMTPGSVIELDKMAGEPVDILVNGKPIAKGEVVVIDENFGVRITEVLSPARVHTA